MSSAYTEFVEMFRVLLKKSTTHKQAEESTNLCSSYTENLPSFIELP